MSDSFFSARNADRFVTVWPSVTGESAFYDVVFGPTADDASGDECGRTDRVTAREAACYVITELGCPLGADINSITRQIADWRARFDARVLEIVEPRR